MSRLFNKTLVRSTFDNQMEANGMTALIDAIALPYDSDQETEKHRWLSPPPQFTKDEGPRRIRQLKTMGIDITNEPYQNALSIPIPSLQRLIDSGAFDTKMAGMVERHNSFRLGLCLNVVLAGASGTVKAADGQNYFSATHADGASGTQINLLTKTELPALAVAAPTAPTADQAAAAIQQSIAWMQSILDEEGEPMNELANSFVIVTANNALGAAVGDALTRENLASGATNPLYGQMQGPEGLKIRHFKTPRVKAWTASYAIFRADAPGGRPLVLQEEMPIDWKVLDEDSEHAFHNNEVVAGARWRGAAGPGLWQYANLNTFATP